MTSISADISKKIDPNVRTVLVDLHAAITAKGVECFFVGARARDILFEAIYGIPARSRTNDVDVAILVASWRVFESLLADLTSSGVFTRDRKVEHRLHHRNGMQVDILPFGEVESPPGVITWPTSDLRMTMLGFREAMDSAVDVQISPDVTIKVSTIPSLAMLKLISWAEKYPERDNDAKDIDYVLRHYAETGQEERIYAGDEDLLDSADFDLGTVGARLLGRDIARIASAETSDRLLQILERETGDETAGRIIGQMVDLRIDRERKFGEQRELLNQLRLGFLDGKHRTT